MATNVGEINVTINVDTRSLQVTLNQTRNMFENTTDQMQRSTRRVAQGFTVLKGAVANVLGNVMITAMDGAKNALFGYNMEMENTEAGFKTLLGSGEKAKTLMEDLAVFAEKTPFELKTLTEASSKLLNYQVELKNVQPLMQQLGDISQGNAQKFGTLVDVFGKVSSSTKFQTEDLNRLIDSGFNPLIAISEKTGESQVELRERMAKGGLSVDELKYAMQEATKEGGMFYQSLETQSKTFSGQLSTLKEAFNKALGEGLKPIFNFLRDTGLPIVNSLVQNMPMIFQKASELIQPFINFVKQLLTSFSSLNENVKSEIWQQLYDVFILIQPVLKNIYDVFADFAQKVAEIAIETFNTAMEALPEILEKAKTALKFVIDNFDFLFAAVTGAYTAIMAFKLLAFIQSMGGLAAMVLTTIANYKALALSVWASTTAFLANPLTWIAIGIGVLIAAIILLIKNWDWLKNKTLEVLKTIQMWFIKTWDNVKVKTKELFNVIVSYITEKINTIIEFFALLPGKIYGYAVSLFKKINAAAVSGMTLFINFVSDKIKSLVDTFKNLPKILYDLGKNIFQGLLNGLSSMIGKIKSKVKFLSSLIPDSVKNILKIGSPSKIMYELGQDTGKGLQLGLESTQKLVTDATTNLSGNTISSVNDTTSQGFAENNTNINLYLDAELIAKASAPHLVKEIHLQGVY